MRQGFLKSAALVVCLLLSGLSAAGQNQHGKAEVKKEARHDVSPPLRDIHPAPLESGPPHEHMPLHPMTRKAPTVLQQDPVVQATVGPSVATTNGLNLAGVGIDFVGPQGSYSVVTAPPDTNGAAGVTQYVQWVNTSFAVFDKSTGSPVYGPAAGNTLWTGFGGACESDNDGDITVKFDRAAGRWIFSQLAIAHGPPYYQCVAVSTGIDATGSYNRYAFSFPSLNDYPKLGIWSDAYYFSFNMFQGNTFLGANACAADRNQMITGGPATMQCFSLDPSFNAVLPSDLDGITPPAAGSPNFFVGIAPGLLNVWKLHADFANPANSTFTGPGNITVAPYNEACNGGGTCVPQSGTKQQLDSLGDRLMYRLAYRNFGDHEALVVNHSVTSGSSVGVRWYEVRDPNGAQTLYQQGTFAPDTSFRWMGSIAMDKAGNIAMGYSVSSGSMHPAIRYTGRAPSDPLGTMQAETSIKEGTGSQTAVLGIFPLSRWGDYTSMAIDPTDDCTFWYTNEYLQANGAFNWSTRIASFSFPSCAAAPAEPDFYVAVSPGLRLVPAGTSTTFGITLNPMGGFSDTVTFSATGLPAGATVSFSPPSLSVSGSATMTVTVAQGTPLGTYPVTINAASGAGLSHTAMVTVQIYVPATAAFVKADTTSQGTWKGVYGTDGEAIPNDSTNYPAYAQVSLSGATPFTWVGSTTDVRAPQKAAASDRIASAWYSGNSFTFDVNLTDGNAHQVGLYCLDWDGGRAESVTVTDVASGNVLDTRNLTSFGSGIWLLWNVSGHVAIRVARTGGNNAVTSGIFFSPPAVPDFTVSATPNKQSVAQGASTTYTVAVAPQVSFAGAVTFSASGLPAGASASFNPSIVPGTGSSTMTVTVAPKTAAGSYPVTITAASGSLSHSAAVTLQIYVPGIAAFLRTDTTTQGTWKGVYGADGEAIANDSANYPAYAQVNLSGVTAYSWVASTTDVRALQKAAATDRIASTWFAAASFTIDVNLMDGNPHQVGLYCLDWDGGRSETVDVLDASTGSVLDTHSLTSFGNGVWLLWNLSGHVTIRVTRTGGANALASGIFFNVPATPDFNVSVTPSKQAVAQGANTTYTVAAAPSAGFTGTVSFSAGGLPSGATGSFNPVSVSVPGSSTMAVTVGAGTPAGTYPVTITGTSGSSSHTTTATLQVYVPGAAALFAATDTATQGTWKGVYGSDGEAVANDSANYPGYALVSFTGANTFTWVPSTTDVRALQMAAGSSRIASTWYAATNFTIDVNLTDSHPHEVGLYCLDWDGGRSETIDILDAGSGLILDTRSVSSFGNGVWMLWNLSGHVTIRVTRTGGLNAVLSGIFFNAPATPDFSLSVTPAKQVVLQGGNANFTAAVAPTLGFTGTVTLSASGLPAGATASFSPSSVSLPGSATMTVNTTAAMPGGAYTVTVTGTSGSVSHSATVALVVNVPVPAAASFVETDTTTQGTWKSVYGASGEAIPNDSANYPAYAQVSFTGATPFNWAASTTDVRALQKAAASGRIASAWYTTTNFTIDLNLMDGNPHQIGIYCLDWDTGRTETVDILDATSGSVLDTRSVSSFANGQWLLWNLSGHVTIRVTRNVGSNAVLSGLFFNN
jgi:hypothetical protein